MTGRELIVYILQNNLEDKPVIEDGKFVGFITVNEAAAKLGVGPATINSWIALGLMRGTKIGDMTYIPDVPNNYESIMLTCRICK